MRALPVLLIFGLVAASGCLTAKVPTDDTDADSTASGTASGTATSSGSGSPTAGAKTATLSASVANGTAPLVVAFTINATGGPQSWSLAFGDGNSTNGTAFPGAANHTYTAGGLAKADLSVLFTDGSTLQRNVTVNVTAAAAGGEVLVSSVPFSADGMILVGTQGDPFVLGGCGVADTETFDIESQTWDLGAAIIGSGAAITKIVAHMDLAETNVDSDIFLLNPAGAVIGSSQDFNQPGLGTGSPTEDFEVAGPLPAGTYTFVVRGCVAVAGDYTITATASIGTA